MPLFKAVLGKLWNTKSQSVAVGQDDTQETNAQASDMRLLLSYREKPNSAS